MGGKFNSIFTSLLRLQTSDLTPSSDANPLLSAAYLSGAFSDEFDSKVHFAGWLASAKVALKMTSTIQTHVPYDQL